MQSFKEVLKDSPLQGECFSDAAGQSCTAHVRQERRTIIIKILFWRLLAVHDVCSALYVVFIVWTHTITQIKIW